MFLHLILDPHVFVQYRLPVFVHAHYAEARSEYQTADSGRRSENPLFFANRSLSLDRLSKVRLVN